MSGAVHKVENVFWLGGSPCAGKSSISNVLAERFKLEVYHVDEAFDVQAQRLDPVTHPALAKWEASSWEKRWMQPVESLVADAIACYQEHFGLILEDILSLSQRHSLLVEGTALLPGQVSRLLSQRSRAVWVAPTAGFQREHYSKREWVRGVVEQCSNAEAAFDNWMKRDARFAEWVEAEVRALNLQLLKVDGSQTIEETAEAVAAHFQLIDNQSQG